MPSHLLTRALVGCALLNPHTSIAYGLTNKVYIFSLICYISYLQSGLMSRECNPLNFNLALMERK